LTKSLKYYYFITWWWWQWYYYDKYNNKIINKIKTSMLTNIIILNIDIYDFIGALKFDIIIKIQITK